MKERIIEKQDQIIANLKEVGQLYFKINGKATKQDVIKMASLVSKGGELEEELVALKAQDIPNDQLISAEVKRVISERMPTVDEIAKEADSRFIDRVTKYVQADKMDGFIRCGKWLRSCLTNDSQKTKGGKESSCPKCGSKFIMEHQYDDRYKICMSCKHNWKE